ncbi:MAG TPA: type II toxin-antitoxin system HipA family toxin [Solirubrobacterales bacterium]|nr:type II toxin-antitoxin system HipA family toxin [Solirubrobacterales bacterium]
MTSLDVYLHEDRVGRLERLPQARLDFAYEPEWIERGGAPVSLSLPVRAEPFPDEECRPFFKGLLPEGEFLKSIARSFHVSAENSFTVLSEIGGECAGAITLVPPGSTPPFESDSEPRWLDEAELAELIDELPSPRLLGDDEGEGGAGFRLSLAGTRDKLAILWGEDRVGITHGRPPSTHIVKKPVAELRAMVANESYCLALARHAGLSVAEALPLAAGDQEGLLVRRYDRRREAGGAVRRLHQEDFCQALGILPELKYQAEGGPDVAACGALIRHHAAAPAVDLLAFLDALLFNLMIGNTDAHGKNYSLLLDDGGPRLAPLYDLLSARVYWPFERKMAMKYGGEYRADRIRGRHLDRLAADLEVSPAVVRRRAGEMAERTLAAAAPARDDLPAPWRGAELIEELDSFLVDGADSLRRAAAEPA